jgi:hypothetical protein
MSKFNLSEAAKDILMANVSSKQGAQDGPKKLSAAVAYGTKDAGKIGDSPDDMDDTNPDYTKGVPSAKPPGATPPVGAESMKKLSAQPGQSAGRSDLNSIEQGEESEENAIRDRKPAKLAKQTMSKNPGATFASYGEEFDVADDVDALMEGENLSEEFKQKATTIFEAAVSARVDYIAEQVQAELIEEMQEVIEEIKEDLAAKVDDYLNYMVEEWMTENEIAIERGLKSEIAEDFISGLKDLFVEHWIDIPEEKVDIVEELTLKVEELEETLNEQILRGIELKKELNEQLKYEAIYTACEGLSQAQVEKMKALAEGVEFTSETEFTSKLETLKESYFKSDVKVADILALDDEVQLIEEEKKYVKSSDPMMEQYAKTISQNLNK